jgi:pimeloyl-ACP methyl ester carboxylesterase
MEEKFITVSDNKIRYFEDGNSDLCLILWHGLGGYAERWNQTIPFLSKKFHLFAPDLIGYGQSDKPPVDYTMEFFVKFVFEFIETIGVKETYMIGTSLGGQIVAECAAIRNPIIRKIVLSSPAGIMRKSTPALDAYTMAALYPSKESVKSAYQMMVGPNKQVSETSVERFIQNMSRQNAKMVFLSTLLGLKNNHDISEKLKTIKIPTLIIWGKEDNLIPFEYAEKFVSLIHNCQLVPMEDCGHSPYVEDPKKFSDYVTKFLLD